jgi:hypothetical protein
LGAFSVGRHDLQAITKAARRTDGVNLKIATFQGFCIFRVCDPYDFGGVLWNIAFVARSGGKRRLGRELPDICSGIGPADSIRVFAGHRGSLPEVGILRPRQEEKFVMAKLKVSTTRLYIIR